jgi:5'(3')-deoxyribonucleotidase
VTRNPPRVLLDLDCVLADFIGAACRAHGVCWAAVEPHAPVGRYGITPAIGKALGRDPFTEAEFWSRINGHWDFWCGMDRLPWARDVADLVRSVTDDWWVVTGPSRCDFCVTGKLRWCRRFFDVGHFDRLIPTHAKHLLANPHTLLIDDSDANVDSFRAPPAPHAGGAAILFPAHHNTLHDLRADPLRHVRESLDYYLLNGRTP